MRRLLTINEGGAMRAGVEIDGIVVDLATCGWGSGDEVTVRSVLAQGRGSAERAIEAAERALSSATVEGRSLSDVTLGPVIPNPDKVICVGANYREHLEEANYPAPPFPEVFAKYPNALIGSGAPIPVNDVSDQVDYEGELALIIGERCKHVAERDAFSVIAGFAPVNDISARDVQLRVSQWVIGKTLDGFAPLGPGLVPTSFIEDPHDLDIETRLNGEVVQSGNTSSLIFDIPAIITYLSSMMTLEPGDVICTGTPGGVGLFRDPPLFLKHGDTVEVELTGLGVLSNPVNRVESAPLVGERAASG